MTDAPLTAEERAELLALCECATTASVPNRGYGEWAQADYALQKAARTGLPRALRDLERAEAEIARKTAELIALREQYNAACDEIGRLRERGHELRDEAEGIASFLAAYGTTKGDVLGALKWLTDDQDSARAENARLLAELRVTKSLALEEVERMGGENARLRRALDAAGIVLGSET